MFLLRLLTVFVFVPAVLILLAMGTPMGARFWILMAVFPGALILFALWRHFAVKGGEA